MSVEGDVNIVWVNLKYVLQRFAHKDMTKTNGDSV